MTVAIVTVMSLATLPAGAKFPGSNGRILYGEIDPVTDTVRVFVANPDGTHVADLGVNSLEDVRWSPDGSKILLANQPTRSGFSRPATINPDGSGYRLLDASKLPLDFGQGDWSPDGKRIIENGFNEDHPELSGFYTMRASDGGGLRFICGYPCTDFPTFSPDGSQIAFEKPTRDPHGRDTEGGRALFVMNEDGTGIQQITTGGLSVAHGTGPSWSPDGRLILFASKAGGVWIVHPDGTGLHQILLTVVGGWYVAFSPMWSPDGTKIVLTLALQATGGQIDVYTMNADGTDLVQVMDTPVEDRTPDWGPSPLAT